VLRCLILYATLASLIFGLCLLRSCRFEGLADVPVIELTDLKSALPRPPDGVRWKLGSEQPELLLTARPGGEHLALTFVMPYAKTVEALHIRMKMTPHQLVKGENQWEDVRVLIRWEQTENGEKCEIDPVAAAFSENGKRTLSVVARPSAGRGIPILMIENLAESGEVLITDLELRPVKQRTGWGWFRISLAVGWFLWIAAFLSGSPRITRPRRYAAAGLWLALGIFFAFPGPWKRLSPLIIPFDLMTETATAGVHHKMEKNMPLATVKQETEGKIQAPEGWILSARYHLKPLRPLLHIAFLSAVTVGFILLIGDVRRAAWLALGIVLAMEGTQFGFGYGFDIKDVLDLGFGFLGIFLAAIAFRRLRKLRGMPAPLAKLIQPSVAHRLADKRQPIDTVDR